MDSKHQEKYGMRNLQEASNQMLQSYGQRYTLSSPVSDSYDDENVADPTPQPINETPVQNVQGEPSVLYFVVYFFMPAYLFLLYGTPKFVSFRKTKKNTYSLCALLFSNLLVAFDWFVASHACAISSDAKQRTYPCNSNDSSSVALHACAVAFDAIERTRAV